MQQLSIRKVTTICFLIFVILLVGQKDAFCSFDVDWGKSCDPDLTNLTGDHLMAQWLVGTGYYNNFNDAGLFARTGYIGYDSSDNDPFYWSLTKPVTVEIVQEAAGYAGLNTLGYYTGGGHFKSMTEVFSGTESGPKTLPIDHSFGLYIGSPENNFWYTDRGENDIQDGSLRKSGGNAQALIYELNPNQEWLVAWEDLDATKLNSDRDYNDMYVKVSIATAPEPVSSVLFLLGSGVLAAAGKMRKKKNN